MDKAELDEIYRETGATFARIMAAGREEFAPEPGDPDHKFATCSDCGDEFSTWDDDDRTYCAWCGAARQVSAQDQMSGRFGPVYERACRKQFAYWTREMNRLGLKPGG